MADLRRAVLWWGFRALCRTVAGLGRALYGLEAEGLEHLPRTGPLVVVCRRISRVDFFAPALFCTLVRGEFSGITSAMAVSNSRLLASAAESMGILANLKGAGLSAMPLLTAYKMLKQGKILLLADEGEVPWDGRLQPLRAGAAWLALRTHAPVVAGMVHGGYDAWPRWARGPRRGAKLTMRFSEPFHLADRAWDRVTPAMIEAGNRRLVEELATLSRGYMLRRQRVSA
ncbi:MAG: 1-acyl-sn-glycerol-3-phosphate acyltransferase [Candidatus Rokubacteria bacterium]|nr:1-acyl-sn-glycerol-3-phosphate acyltransferase [Candidatus Rokubacteria bacterium]